MSRSLPTAAPAPKATRTRKAAPKAGLTANQKIAVAVGGVGCFVLALSVWHCTEALMTLTGSPVVLAALLAIGIDCGMVACEMASIAGTGDARKWADRYIGLAVVLSMILNSVASGSHATNMVWLAYGVGAVIPVLVFVLGKVAGHMWKS